MRRLPGTTSTAALSRTVQRASGYSARVSTNGAMAGSGDEREAVRQRYREALQISRRAGAAADAPSPPPLPSYSPTAAGPAVNSSIGRTTIRERRGKSRHGGVWWPDDDREQKSVDVTPEQRAANRQRYANAISSTRDSGKRAPHSMASKPSGFGFNAIMSELDQLAGRDSHYPLFERSVFDQHRAEKAAAETRIASSTPAQPLHDDNGGLTLRPCGSDRQEGLSQRRDYWSAMELQALREVRAEILQDPTGPAASNYSDCHDWNAETWESVSGWLAMQGYNRSGPECAAASAADVAALAPDSLAVGNPKSTSRTAEAIESAQDTKIAEEQALLKRHSDETLRLVDRAAASGRLRPMLSEADVIMAAELRDSASTALSTLVAVTTVDSDAAVPIELAAKNEFPGRTSSHSTMAARVEAAAGAVVRQSGLLERESEVRVLILAVLASEHILIFGPPGTGKTTLCRHVASIFRADTNFSTSSKAHRSMQLFERLVTRFSVPEELLGPLSLSALRNDTHVRLTEGYLSTANIAFLDELFKASSSLLNCLLEILADRHTTEGASTPVHSPLVCMMGTSGRLPEEAQSGGELAALFDRFLLRVTLQPLSLAGRMKLFQSPPSDAASTHVGSTVSDGLNAATFSLSEAAAIRTNAVDVALPDDVVAIMEDTTRPAVQLPASRAENISQPGARSDAATCYLSDRRMVACASLLRLIAYTSGRDEVHPLDCLLLRHCLPQHDADDPVAADRVTEKMLGACAVSASATEELNAGLELQNRILAHLTTAPSRSPAHGSSRDWRQRPVGVLAASVGRGPAFDSSGSSVISPLQSHLKILSEMHQQIDVHVQRIAGSTSELQIAYKEARDILLSHPWLSTLERDALATQLKEMVDAHVDNAHRACAELLAIGLWVEKYKSLCSSAAGKLDTASGVTRHDTVAGPALPPLLSLMPQATASVLRDLLAPTSNPEDQRSALRLVQTCGFHADMITGGAAPQIQTYSKPKQRGAIEMWAAPHGGGMP